MIFTPCSKAKYELKVVPYYSTFGAEMQRGVPGFINIPVADFFIDKLAS